MGDITVWGLELGGHGDHALGMVGDRIYDKERSKQADEIKKTLHRSSLVILLIIWCTFNCLPAIGLPIIIISNTINFAFADEGFCTAEQIHINKNQEGATY
jgi:hypothetical protein